VYGSAAEATQAKADKATALQQYKLSELEEVALASNIHGMEVAFKLRFKDRQVLFSANTKNLMAKWMLAIDTAAFRSTISETQPPYLTKLEQRTMLLRRLYLPSTDDGPIYSIIGNVVYRWKYKKEEASSVGELVSNDGKRAFTWDSEYMRPKCESTNSWGYGLWDGIWLTWYTSEMGFIMRYQWHSAIEEFHFASACKAIEETFSVFPPFRFHLFALQILLSLLVLLSAIVQAHFWSPAPDITESCF